MASRKSCSRFHPKQNKKKNKEKDNKLVKYICNSSSFFLDFSFSPPHTLRMKIKPTTDTNYE